MPETEKLTGAKLLAAAVNQILEHPETWDQAHWHCGTTHCVGGWCQILAGKATDYVTAREDAQTALGLTGAEASWLFAHYRTLPEIYRFTRRFVARSSSRYDWGGYDQDGYDRSGCNRAGYNQDGYNQDGYDRAWDKMPMPLFDLS